jgi:hypothetical protein
LNYKQSLKDEKARGIIDGYLSPIRDMPKDKIPQSVGGIIGLCATIYCGMQKDKVLPEVLQESVRFVYKNYPMIGVNEIREAFSMAAANQFEGVNMTAYFGTFTVSMLGDILSPYANYRNAILSKALDYAKQQEKQAKADAEREQKNNAAREKIKTDIEQAIIQIQTDSSLFWPTWHEVPVHYAEIAIQNNYIEVDSDFKQKIWQEAKIEAKRELIEQASDLSNLADARKAKELLRKHIESEVISEPAKRIYSKMLIFNYILIHKI